MKKRIIILSLLSVLLIIFITYRYGVYQERYDKVKFYEFSDKIDHLSKVESDEVYTRKVNSLEKNYLKSLYSCEVKDENDAFNVIIDADKKRSERKYQRLKDDIDARIKILKSTRNKTIY